MTIFTQTLQGNSGSGLSPASELVPHTSATSSGGLKNRNHNTLDICCCALPCMLWAIS